MGWRPMMIGATDHVKELAARHPISGRRRMWSLHFGDEVLVDTRTIELATPRMRNVRQAVQRTKNSGVTVYVAREGSLTYTQRSAMLAVVDEWEAGRGTYGYSMTMDHLLDGVHRDAIVVVAEWNGEVVGFQRWFEARNGTGLTLDVMPRRRHCPNGVNERLIIEAADWARHHGISELSLNFAAFRWVFEASPSPARAAAAKVVHLLDRFLDVESLYRFNAKFNPTWHPRHVMFESLYDIPLVVAAAIRLEFGRRPERALTAQSAHTATTTP
jgi:lysyl-tRNA synthetase class 2